MKNKLDFTAINSAAMRDLPALLDRFAPGGRVYGREWMGLNPRRSNSTPGSFKINLTTGRWADFATNDKGGDAVSLVAYLTGLAQGEAASRLATMLGVHHG